MELDFSALSRISTTCGISPKEWKSYQSKISKYLQAISSREQGFVDVLTDEKIIVDIEKFAQNCRGKYTDIVLLGIGGSALGAKALRDILREKGAPTFHVLDNIDPVVIADLESQINIQKALFLVISKSGNTLETLTQYEYFSSRVSCENFVFVTGTEGTLRKIAKTKNIPVFTVPENVGGRFSVLSVVGLLPASLLGIDIRALLAGAKEMCGRFLSTNFEENTPFQLALLQYLFFQKQITQHVFMPYSAQMRSFSEWWSQLIAESTGKDNKGITPIMAQGVTDQHSLLQLLAQGPRDKFVIFLKVESLQGEESFLRLLHAEMQATADSLTELNRPNVVIAISEISSVVLGQLFFFFEGVTAFLGELMEIDTFNQPGVERAKELARRYLK